MGADSKPVARRSFLLLSGVGLVLVLVLAYAGFSLVETERKARDAAEAQGRALLVAVSAGVERSLDSSRALEQLLADRLLELTRQVGRDLAAEPGREERLLADLAARHDLKLAVLLDPEFRVLAASGPRIPGPPGAPPAPLSASRLEPVMVTDLVGRARARGLGEMDAVVVGFGENPFGTRLDFIVGAELAAPAGYLILRQDAESLRAFRKEAGLERLLLDAAGSAAIEYLDLEGAEGAVLASSHPERVVAKPARAAGDVTLPVSWEGSRAGALRVGLAAGPVDDVIRRGRRSIYLFTAVIMLLGVGGAAGLVLLDRRRREKEAALTEELSKRERAAALGRLAAGVAHEVRSPLNAIGMAAQRLEREARTDEPDLADVRSILKSMRNEVSRLNGTVEEFLDLGRPRPLSFTSFDPGELIAEVIAVEAPGARLVRPGLPLRLRADREEIRKAVANLVRNARAAAGEGEVVVAFEGVGPSVSFSVRDAGSGIPLDLREEVFEHFYTKRPGGTGLGLAIVRAVAERHGGAVTVGDAPEGGAMFTLTIPGREDQ